MKRKFYNLSIYRILATILIIQFHVFYLTNLSALNNEYLLSKFMQGLTALSGFLYSQKLLKDYKSFYLGNIKKLAIPALLVILFMATWNLGYMFAHQEFNYLSLFMGVRPYNNAPQLLFGNFYYIGYILICYLITPILQRCDKFSNITIVLTIVIEVLIGFFMGSASIIISYIIGYYIGKKSFKDMTDPDKKYDFKILIQYILILLVGLFGFLLTRRYQFNDSYFLKNLMNTINNFSGTIFGVATFFLFAYMFRFVNKTNKNIALLNYTDKLSYVLYLFNQAFMVGSMSVLSFSKYVVLDYIYVYGFTILASMLVQFVYDFLFNKKKIIPKGAQYGN